MVARAYTLGRERLRQEIIMSLSGPGLHSKTLTQYINSSHMKLVK